MSAISTTRATERLTRRLNRAGINRWIGQSSGDTWGKYLVFEIGGRCTGGAGWTLAEAEEAVERLIAGDGEAERQAADRHDFFADLACSYGAK